MKKGKVTPEVAAAISMAMDMESSGDVYAAIAMAMHLYLDGTVHDAESYVITIKRDGRSDWNIKGQNFRRKP